jgi:hypothetical protein
MDIDELKLMLTSINNNLQSNNQALASIQSRLQILEESNEDAEVEFDLQDLDENLPVTPNPRRSTISEARKTRRVIPKAINSVYSVKQCDAKLFDLEPIKIARFIGIVNTYQITYSLTANLSEAFPSVRTQQALIAASNGLYNSTNIGTITLNHFQEIVKQHLQVHTVIGFKDAMIKSCEFPSANITELTPKTFPLFRSLFMQYISEFETVCDLLSFNKASVPPTNNQKNLGLIWIFNQPIPFDFGEGIFDQIAFTPDGSKRKWSNISDYIQEVEAKLEEFYKDLSQTQHFYDAIKKPTKIPRAPKLFQRTMSSNNNTHSRPKNLVQELDADELSVSSKATTRSTSDNGSMNADLMQISDDGNKVTACYGMVFKGECKKLRLCPHSHDPKIIKECKARLLKQLSDSTTA